jgi:hypothetical protein
MGWTFFPHRGRKTADIIREELTQTMTSERAGFSVLAGSMVGSVWYGAVQRQSPSGEVTVFGVVVLTKRTRQGEIGYKVIDEDCGPYEAKAPVRLIQLLRDLAPNPNENAREWRTRCLEHAHAKAAQPAWESGMRVTYGPASYRLHTPAGARKGWYVTRTSDGALFRMGARQLAQAKIEE